MLKIFPTFTFIIILFGCIIFFLISFFFLFFYHHHHHHYYFIIIITVHHCCSFCFRYHSCSYLPFHRSVFRSPASSLRIHHTLVMNDWRCRWVSSVHWYMNWKNKNSAQVNKVPKDVKLAKRNQIFQAGISAALNKWLVGFTSVPGKIREIIRQTCQVCREQQHPARLQEEVFLLYEPRLFHSVYDVVCQGF